VRVTSDSPDPGWYQDPVAADMLRWWDGTAWSETEFKLAKPVTPAAASADSRLGPLGRRGSLLNLIVCSAVLVGFVIFAVTEYPAAWFGVMIVGLVDCCFIVIAVVVRRRRLPRLGERMITAFTPQKLRPKIGP
jgi:hypothetical protein